MLEVREGILSTWGSGSTEMRTTFERPSSGDDSIMPLSCGDSEVAGSRRGEIHPGGADTREVTQEQGKVSENEVTKA